MKILLAQLNPKIGDLTGNTDKIIDVIERYRDTDTEMIVFPELSICGYLPADLFLHESFISGMEKELDRIVRASKNVVVIVGFARRNPNYEEKDLLNSAAVIQNQKLLGVYDKCLLPTYDVFSERRYFARGKSAQVYLVNGKRVAVLICEDIWQHAGYEISGTNYQLDPVKELVTYKPDIVVNLTASPFITKKVDKRVEVCRAVTKTLKCPIVYACQVGSNDSLIFDGYSLYLDENGVLRQVAKGFVEDEMVIDTEKKPYGISYNHDEMYDLYAALRLGVRDYFKKSNQKTAIVSLSGGIDSAIVAAIARDALGAENIIGVHIPSQNTSKESREDAFKLAENLGIDYKEIPINATFQHLKEKLEPTFLMEKHLYENTRAQKDDITLENLEARIRGVLLMSLANKCRGLVLNTGNKSEIALGYTTLYGDAIGALSVIGDLVKTECYRVAHWINREYELIPKRTIEKPPTTILRHHQYDDETLPPYEIVDRVIEAYVEQHKTLEEIVNENNYSAEQVDHIIRRIFKHEHKRGQAPPILKVTTKCFGAGRMYPLHSSYKTEIY